MISSAFIDTPQASKPIKIFKDGDDSIYIHCDDPDLYQWLSALSKVTSAAVRAGVPLRTIAEDLQAVFDPKGGRLHPKTHRVTSLVGEIGIALGEMKA